MVEKTKQYIRIELEGSLVKWLRRMAKEQNMDVSRLVENALWRYFNEVKIGLRKPKTEVK